MVYCRLCNGPGRTNNYHLWRKRGLCPRCKEVNLTDAFLMTTPSIMADLRKYVEKDTSFLDTLINPRGRLGGMRVVSAPYLYPSTTVKAKEPMTQTNNLGLSPKDLAQAIRLGNVLPVRDGFVTLATPVWWRSNLGPQYLSSGPGPSDWSNAAAHPDAYSIAKPDVAMGVAVVVPSVDYTKVDLQQVRLADGYLVSPANPPQYLWFYNSLTQRAERHLATTKVASIRQAPHLWFRNEPNITPGKFVRYND